MVSATPPGDGGSGSTGGADATDEVVTVALDGVLVVTVNRPKVRNALNRRVADGIAEAMQRLDEDPHLHVGVITGEGGHFSAGTDLKVPAAERPYIPGRGYAGIAERPPVKPVLAAVEGYALGGGFELALACDMIIASREALFGLPEVRVGVIASGGALIHLPRRVPRNIAAELAFVGGPIRSERLARLGIVNLLTEPGDARRVALATAEEIGHNSPSALTATKEVLGFATDFPEAEAWRRQHEVVARVEASADAEEGIRAFVEKRPPSWPG